MPEPATTLDEMRALLAHLPGPDLGAGTSAAARERQLTKPAGALGRLEELAAWLDIIDFANYKSARQTIDMKEPAIQASVFRTAGFARATWPPSTKRATSRSPTAPKI